MDNRNFEREMDELETRCSEHFRPALDIARTAGKLVKQLARSGNNYGEALFDSVSLLLTPLPSDLITFRRCAHSSWPSRTFRDTSALDCPSTT